MEGKLGKLSCEIYFYMYFIVGDLVIINGGLDDKDIKVFECF